jgi:hypothetical protein
MGVTGKWRDRIESELLRADHGHEEIEEEEEGDEPDEDGFHGDRGRVLEFLAEADVEAAENEERDDDAEIEEVTHGAPPGVDSGWVVMDSRSASARNQRINGRRERVKKVSKSAPILGPGLPSANLQSHKSLLAEWCLQKGKSTS